MSDVVRYYFDNHLPKAVVRKLRQHGVDILTAHEAGLSRKPDPDLLRLATAEGRVVVTHDEDFKILAADFQSRGETFAGVVYCDPARYVNRPGLLIQNMLILHGVYTVVDMIDRLEHL